MSAAARSKLSPALQSGTADRLAALDWHTIGGRLDAHGCAVIAGILSVLDALDAADIAYAVGSNGSDRKMQVTLGQHPALLARLQGRLFSGQTLGRPKPAPDLYLHAAQALGQRPQDCVVIEDSATGARAAQAAGIRCFGYVTHGDGAALAAEGAEIFTDMAALPGLLGLAA